MYSYCTSSATVSDYFGVLEFVIPLRRLRWYSHDMSTTYAAAVGDRGRLVIPSALRRSQKWEQGTQLLMLDTPNGVITMTQKQAKQLIKNQIGAGSLVEELLAERRSAAQKESL